MMFQIWIVIDPRASHPYVQTYPMSQERYELLTQQGCRVYTTHVDLRDERVGEAMEGPVAHRVERESL